jgi:transcriptional/translational regulatory protein YebC/TACO1
MVAKTTMTPDEKAGTQVVRLIERLEELDDVQRVFSNAELSEELIEAAS